ncbi:MAG TPA: hypothetical protein DGG94_17545 [Micromonosporaceae bacterium]|nr:hypothetical protein [Micromonosporaceae bacterium]HCU51575.1 hypothetical protein [Micromonosporaceae bacterium]
MSTGTKEASLQSYARVAGFAYLAIIIGSILNLIFVDSKLIVDGDAAATTTNVAANESLFRIGSAVHLVMFAGVVLLSLNLYAILKTVNRNLALLALLWRMAEAIVGVVTVFAGMFVALLINDFKSFDTQQVQALVDLFLRARAIGFDFVIFFLALGTIVFCYLFYRSRFIPRSLAAYGIASLAIMLVGSLANIVTPRYADLTMVSYAPGILFELGIGAWLLLKGVKLPAS